MVREQGHPLPMNRRDTLRRLGTEIVNCPRCNKPFKLAQKTLWFVLRMVNGETSDDEKNDDPFCGTRCANLRADELNREAEEGVMYIPWGNPNWTQ